LEERGRKKVAETPALVKTLLAGRKTDHKCWGSQKGSGEKSTMVGEESLKGGMRKKAAKNGVKKIFEHK